MTNIEFLKIKDGLIIASNYTKIVIISVQDYVYSAEWAANDLPGNNLSFVSCNGTV